VSITYVSSITPTTATLRDGCTDELNNQVIIVESNGNTIRGYNLNTGAQNFNFGVSSAPSCVSLIATGIAAVGYSGTSVIDFVQLSSGFRQSGAAGTTTSTVKGQLMAADLSLQKGFMCSSTARQYFRYEFDGTTGAVTSFTNSNMNTSSQTNCVILKSPGRWLFGTTCGQVFEVDGSGAIVDMAEFGLTYGGGNLSVSTNTAINIAYMSYSDNLLLIQWTNGTLQLVDWSTKKVLNNFLNSGGMLSHASSGVCIGGRTFTTNTTNNVIFEVDFTIFPYSTSLPLFTDQTSATFAAGINTSTGRSWALQTTPRIRIFDLVPRASTTALYSYQPLGEDVPYRLTVLQDNGSSSQVVLDTFSQSPGTYRLPVGKSLINIYRYGEGATALYQVTRTQT
jgi:hypothetical protein